MSEKKNEQNEQWAKFAAALTRKLVATGKFEAVPHGVEKFGKEMKKAARIGVPGGFMMNKFYDE